MDLLITRALYLLTAIVLIANTVVLTVRVDRNKATFDRIVDCTTPSHSCYDESQRRLAQTVDQLEKIVIASNFCTRDTHNDTLAKVETCVMELLH